MGKVGEYYDPIAGAKTEHFIDAQSGKFYSRYMLEMTETLRYAKEKRAAMGDRSSIRACDLGFKKGHLKPMGVAPYTIYKEHPEFAYDMDALKLWLETYPDFKTTNKRL